MKRLLLGTEKTKCKKLLSLRQGYVQFIEDFILTNFTGVSKIIVAHNL